MLKLCPIDQVRRPHLLALVLQLRWLSSRQRKQNVIFTSVTNITNLRLGDALRLWWDAEVKRLRYDRAAFGGVLWNLTHAALPSCPVCCFLSHNLANLDCNLSSIGVLRISTTKWKLSCAVDSFVGLIAPAALERPACGSRSTHLGYPHRWWDISQSTWTDYLSLTGSELFRRCKVKFATMFLMLFNRSCLKVQSGLHSTQPQSAGRVRARER